jgi:hypothetical protein
MKFSIAAIAVLIGATVAAPTPQGTVSNDLVQGGCKKIVLVYARASTEIGNMVSLRTNDKYLPSLTVDPGNN